jgi:hypothetical protein
MGKGERVPVRGEKKRSTKLVLEVSRRKKVAKGMF